MKKIYLETFGCQMNVLDSELVEGQLRLLGYDFVTDAQQADIVLYNTCSVREKSEQKVLSRLGRLRERKRGEPELIIGVIGCMAERDGMGMLKRWPQVDLLCGPGELDKLPRLLENVLATHKQQAALAGANIRRSGTLAAAGEDHLELLDLSRSFSPEKNKYQAYIRVVRGCNKFCAYCVVPYTRGPEVSRTPQAILDEARRLVDAGAREITLLGQTVNHYVYEHTAASGPLGPLPRRTTFADLLRLVHDQVPQLPRLRFITSFPADFGDDILETMVDCPRICRYLHIPAQSGSNRILKLMNRGYTVESYLELLARARSFMPGLAIVGDLIVGFPTETDADYQATRELVTRARYKNAFIFKYSPRPGTLAMRRHADDVPEAVKRFRNQDLLNLQNDICEQLNRELVGYTVAVLCEGPSGWNESAESAISGAEHSQGAGARVQLGPKLSGLLRTRSRRAAAPAEVADYIQLSGRTTADQIVVFDGPRNLEGLIVPIDVCLVHGLTIFGRFRQNDGLAATVAPAVMA
ncbi:MAG: tRNA (N6-isopentenyl adenosine(37)-C2)-methylthiotransferase MiaB [Phycisphaerae bacterium]